MATEYVTPEHIANKFNVHVETVRRWAREGVIPSITLVSGTIRFDEEAVTARIKMRGPNPMTRDEHLAYFEQLKERQKTIPITTDETVEALRIAMRKLGDPYTQKKLNTIMGLNEHNDVKIYRMYEVLVFDTDYGSNGVTSEFCDVVCTLMGGAFSLSHEGCRELLPLVNYTIAKWMEARDVANQQ